jgi:hypothetical protein
MRQLSLPSALFVLSFLAACGGAPTPSASRQNSNSAANTAQANASNASGIGVASSHGAANGGAAQPAAGDAAADRALVNTTELDARIKKAADKAKGASANAADKKAAAADYLARGNVYWSAGQPRLYKYALADFRQVLKFDPGNEEAQQKIDTIESIYKSMGRPIPEVSPEQ